MAAFSHLCGLAPSAITCTAYRPGVGKTTAIREVSGFWGAVKLWCTLEARPGYGLGLCVIITSASADAFDIHHQHTHELHSIP